jgi:hypothetical protein
MSHITRVKTSIKDSEVLKEVLRKAGYHVREEGVVFSDYNKDKVIKVDILAERAGERIGFRRADSAEGAYEIVADWAMQARGRKEITGDICQAYSRERIVRLAAKKGFSIIENRQNQKGQIEMVLRKVA